MQCKARRLLRDCSGNAETPQREEAQRRPAESEVPGTEMNRLHDCANPSFREGYTKGNAKPACPNFLSSLLYYQKNVIKFKVRLELKGEADE
ncbi:hypothetical protein B14911_24095 [Bacillus sp. NRRL B-14911]|nr:hypothetical protein B14911_24095 [Bacillus sp. NRRL B-14911]